MERESTTKLTNSVIKITYGSCLSYAQVPTKCVFVLKDPKYLTMFL